MLLLVSPCLPSLFLKSQCGRAGGRPRGLAGWRQRGSRDGEIQRYVLKGLVSSGHKHSSPSAPASGACTAQQAWIRTKPLITSLPPLAARFFLSLSFSFFSLPWHSCQTRSYCGSHRWITPGPLARESRQDCFYHPVTPRKQNKKLTISDNNENHFCFAPFPHTDCIYKKYVYKTVITKQRVIFLPP